jgi:hypothetical protein
MATSKAGETLINGLFAPCLRHPQASRGSNMLNILPSERFRLPRQETKIRINQRFPNETLINDFRKG